MRQKLRTPFSLFTIVLAKATGREDFLTGFRWETNNNRFLCILKKSNNVHKPNRIKIFIVPQKHQSGTLIKGFSAGQKYIFE